MAMATDDNDVDGDLDKSNLKFIYEQFRRVVTIYLQQKNKVIECKRGRRDCIEKTFILGFVVVI